MQRKVLNLTVLKREEPSVTQQENIRAAYSLSSLIRTCLGPKAMLKMVLTRMGSIELTNDGNSILREMAVAHPVVQSLVELSRTQSEEVGDGTTSVVLLAVEILQEMGALLKEGVHPVVVGESLKKALEILLGGVKRHSMEIGSLKKLLGMKEEEVVQFIVKGGVGTKISKEFNVPIEEMALKAVRMVKTVVDGKVRVDTKNFVKVEKILGGSVEESEVLDGVIINKDVLNPNMRKFIEKAKVVLLDFPLEYKKGENQMNIEMTDPAAFSRALEVEEEQILHICQEIGRHSPDVVVSEKGICDNAISYFNLRNITAIRRIKKSENLRIAKATGACIISRVEDLTARSVGMCGVFETVRMGEETFARFVGCSAPKACSIVLRGPSRDILNEVERNLHDSLSIAKLTLQDPFVVAGGGSIETLLSLLLERSKHDSEVERRVFLGVSKALKIIPSLLLSNSGCSTPVKSLMELESKIMASPFLGVNGETGEIEDVRGIILEPSSIKEQLLKSAVEASILILRVDGVVRSTKK